ncbi:glycoside hydrolase family 3 C-terminal domain-containing protein [candidate division KSB1 bacterium]|nr:glycoside hydrolase family 3 C-terminal domain-containing protein [candidate division KSB1 bacterium]MBL7093837.1 glycoside hydrolase family 3 C-terminal domain-containing protein [candidate division KSB1 bacterium]
MNQKKFFVSSLSGIILFSILFCTNLLAQKTPHLPSYKHWNLPVEERVEDLLKRMTLEEKINMVSGAKKGELPTNTESTQSSDNPNAILVASDFFSKTQRNWRLGIPELTMTDGPLGPNGKGASTNYSSAINMAATFDDSLMLEVGESIGEETRILGYNMLLAPCINITRAPHNGRTFEAFGEDPFLMSRMAVAFVKGVQSKRVATCTKHYVANNHEWNRMSVDVKVDERALREIYLPAFKAVVQEADGWTIMSAYNQILGHYCCENKYLQSDILKDEWGFKGVVVSDWGGVHSTVKTALSGLDLEMPNGRFLGKDLLNAVKDGKVPESLIEDKARRILRVMFKAALFDESTGTYGGLANTEERRALALKVSQKSIVLLKNENNFLPLKKDAFKSIALIGPNADVAQMCGGGSGSNHGHYGITPLQGIKNKFGCNVKVEYKRGIAVSKLELPVVPESMFFPPDGKEGKNGLWAEYYNNRELEGEPALTRKEKQINFDWGYGEFRGADQPGSPDPNIIQTDRWSARWTGKLASPGDGWYDIGLKSDNGVKLWLDGKLIIDAWTDQAPGKYKITQYEFEANRKYDLVVEFYENWGSCRCIMGLEKFKPGPAMDKAIELAKNSDLAIVCAGLNPEMEGEAKDRDRLNLPEAQINLIKEVAKSNKNIIVVLYNATPIIMKEWLNDVPAVVEAFYPGQEGGNALADILFGDVSPSGKLPLTFMKKWEDSAVYPTYPGERDVAYYKEGIFVGYRHFDKNNIEPLFPFGYGLSYTTFEYSDLKLDKKKIGQDSTVTVSLNVKNTGNMDGDEVVQLYIRDVKASVKREVKALKGFDRISLKVGGSKKITFKINKSALSFYDVKRKVWVAEPGVFKVLVGSSSRDIRLKDKFRLVK